MMIPKIIAGIYANKNKLQQLKGEVEIVSNLRITKNKIFCISCASFSTCSPNSAQLSGIFKNFGIFAR